jgi:hypothetical protein
MARYRDASAKSILQSRISGGGSGGVGGDVYLGETEAVVPAGPRGGKKTIKVAKTTSLADAIAQAYTWDAKQRAAFVAKARALGYTDTTDLTSPNLWAMAVKGSSEWFKNSQGQVKITPEEYLEWYSKSKKQQEGYTGPTTSKTITNYGGAQIRDWINDGLMKKAGRTFESLSDMERSQLYQAVNEYLQKSAITTTRKGKKEGTTITEVTPGPSIAGVEEVISKVGQEILAPDIERQQRINFASWLSQNASGA